MTYSRGPSTEPCGRPYGAGTHRDLVEPWTTLKVRSWRKEPIHPRKLPDSPNVTFNRIRRMLWSTVSKAALTSNKANNVSSARQWHHRCQIVVEVAVSVEWNFPVAETWRRVWGDGRFFRGPRMTFIRKKFPFLRQQFLMTFF